MSARQHMHLASAALSVVLVGIASLLVLAFYMPYMAHAWSETDAQPASWQIMLVHPSEAAVTHGRVLLLLLGLLFCVTLTWRMIASIFHWRIERTTR